MTGCHRIEIIPEGDDALGTNNPRVLKGLSNSRNVLKYLSFYKGSSMYAKSTLISRALARFKPFGDLLLPILLFDF